MADAAPKTRDWSARENKHKPKGLHIIVNGLVQVSDANKTPVLKETKGDGSTLALDLTIESCSDPAIKVPVWKAASYHRVVNANQFGAVMVRWNTKTIATFPVTDDREYSQHLAALMTSVNAKYGKKPAKPPAKKAAPKKAAAAKKKPKSVGGWAKKAKKKTKKAAKKTAKKSAFKKLVRKLVKKLTPTKKKKSKKR
jgi:hypothetical protein